MTSRIDPGDRILVTGATGYVGGRLVPALLDAGYRVRCLVREPRKLESRTWRNDARVEIVTGSLDDAGLPELMAGCRAAYYLVHSMEVSGASYADQDRRLASCFSRAAARAGLKRIVYLGGLGEMGQGLSRHLESRREVERCLAESGVAVTTLRAAMIIGSGSASFEILRYLVERLPVMVTPRWVATESQPIAIQDVLHWLVACLSAPETAGKALEIGGADVLPYRELMQIMAAELGLRPRRIITVPVLTPRLSSLWIHLVTPVSSRIARPLAEGLRNRVVVTNDEARRLMPHDPLSAREAIRLAVGEVGRNDIETRWSVAGAIPGDPKWAGGTRFEDTRSVRIQAGPEAVFAAICRIGGGNGWYAGDVLWRIRGWIDTLLGGPGLRRGRRHPEQVEYGESLDFWRVTGIERNRSLELVAEMILPGTATLGFCVSPAVSGEGALLTMSAGFRPRGLGGLVYWYAVQPFHNLVFGGMLNGIRAAAEDAERRDAAPPATGVRGPSSGSG